LHFEPAGFEGDDGDEEFRDMQVEFWFWVKLHTGKDGSGQDWM
jgi:hypothetical protein